MPRVTTHDAKQLRHVPRQTMHVIAGLRKVGAREFVRRDEGEHSCVDDRAGRLDSVPHKRVAAPPIAVEVADRQRPTARSEGLGEAAGLDDVAIVQHRIDRMRGVLVSEKSRAFISLSEAKP
jgi:hypothetical protein